VPFRIPVATGIGGNEMVAGGGVATEQVSARGNAPVCGGNAVVVVLRGIALNAMW